MYNKKQSCYFCGKLVSKIARHYQECHAKEREVAIAMSFNKKSPERAKQLEKLRLLGNYHHNMKVLEIGEGELIVMRRPSNNESCDPKDFLPCSYCYGFLKRQDLWKHGSSCQFKPAETKKHQNLQANARMMIASATNKGTSSKMCEVITSMRNDEITIVAKNDELIKEVGEMFVMKHGKKTVQSHVSSKMRELARLLVQLRKCDNNQTASLSDFIKPEKFNCMIESVKAVSKFNQDPNSEDEVKIPSLALKLGHSLKKCVNVIRGQALRQKDKELLGDAEDFEKLLESEWSFSISHHSLETLADRKYNKVDLLPITEDLEKLKKNIDTQISVSSKALHCHKPRVGDWSSLAHATLTRIIMLNKRRGNFHHGR